ncbi:hypothetical protein SS1G_07463 [Sclerotinia sclerotiorum 1980 UF-70]|uniref:Alpha/beta hydrolase fold-3 domain-containing protein n=2 Tax=Sclerotinia sclerotiorum (strain ATCC 18683 / 1980 / Ss-1) TaxID=665079 RepID=A7EQ63_SCLS1|nr:hypothetical protein SS1G_07463 [Sclerotinia sclerotiorum 1980 UF-70]APA10140.1 hypothetical protein sscle_06g049100 [Sclerotinia sclerotiorum 1980 UF-70]EDO04979.1 hypothetical protein SS1G_07463 [Sclerotinia sclerotiorum 1980 UF-70]
MPLKSDILIDASKFEPQNTPKETIKANEELSNKLKDGPKWFEIGASEYREMRNAGKTPMPKPKPLPEALDIDIPSRDSTRMIPCRLVYPSWRKTTNERRKTKGIGCLIHGGGWVLGDQHSADTLLQFYADAGDLAVISIGYRLAPEYPFPCGPSDCIDVGEYLVNDGERVFGSSLKFIGGESAGAHLSLLVAFHLLRNLPNFKLSGLVLNCGIYDLTMLPHCRNFGRPDLVLDHTLMRKFVDAFLPDMSDEQKKSPLISPYYEDLEKFRGRLPSALFTCGTEDPLLDDSVTMATKWMMTGGEAVIKIYTGAPHAFISLGNLSKEASDAREDTRVYIRDCMGKL